MAIPLQILAAAQAVRYHGSTLADFPVRTQKVLGVYWLGGRMQLNGKDLITDQYILSPNKVLTMAATYSHTVMVHLARQLSATHVQEAMNMAACRGHARVVRLCRNYDKVNLDKVMVWAAESGHEEVVRMSRIERSTRLRYGLQVAVKKCHAPVS